MSKKMTNKMWFLPLFICLFVVIACNEADTVGTDVATPFGKVDNQFASGEEANRFFDDLLNGSIVSFEYTTKQSGGVHPDGMFWMHTLNENESLDGKPVFDVRMTRIDCGTDLMLYKYRFEKASERITKKIQSGPGGVPGWGTLDDLAKD